MKTSIPYRHLLLVVLLFPLFIHAEGGGPITANVPLNEVGVRAYRYFHKEWRSVTDEVWYKTDGGFVANFSTPTCLVKTFFNSRGVFLYSLKYYAGKDISADMGAMLRNTYPSYRIKVVTEVYGLGKTAYYVTMENSTLVRTLSIIDGKMEVIGELTISLPSGL